MRAVGFYEFGGPDKLQIIERPQPVPVIGQVLVRVTAATVNPTDVMMLRGLQAGFMTGLVPPYVAGMEFAGLVEQCADVDEVLRPGQRVMGAVDPRRPLGGAHSQLLAVSVRSVVPIHSSIDMAEAATLPMNGLTALLCLQALNIQPGGSVLVTGGSGCVGAYVVQLANHFGLTVYADAKDEDVRLLERLGARHVVPRGDRMLEAIRSLKPHGVDGLVDAALLGNQAAALVRDGGTSVSLRRSHAITDNRLNCKTIFVGNELERTADLNSLAELHRSGVLTARVALRLPMEDAARAFDMVERGGLRGRVLLQF
jgi:NADPH:quinone reductase-like Zn-dependent oxidoreductase